MKRDVQLDEAGQQFALDLGRVYDLMALCATALLRGAGWVELAQWQRLRANIGVHLYHEIIAGPRYQELRDSIDVTLTAKGLSTDWLS